MNSNNRLIKLICFSAIAAFSAALIANVGHSDTSSYEMSLRSRSDRIFAYDANVGHLPANHLYALSIALRFRDYQGAEKIVNALEDRIIVDQNHL